MSYFNIKTGEALSKEGAARLLRQGGIVANTKDAWRGDEHYSCWNLKGADKRCEVAKFAPPNTFNPSWKVVYQGPDPWFAMEVGVVTRGVAAQMKEWEEEEEEWWG